MTPDLPYGDQPSGEQGMSETFSFVCPFCDKLMRVPVTAAGRTGKCKQCRNSVIVPKPKPPATPETKLPDSFIPTKRPFPWLAIHAVLGIACSAGAIQTAKTDNTHSRWGLWPTQRLILIHDAAGDISMMGEGPCAQSGSEHGKWTLSMIKPQIVSKTTYFYYGEEVSEAEFHLRTR